MIPQKITRHVIVQENISWVIQQIMTWGWGGEGEEGTPVE